MRVRFVRREEEKRWGVQYERGVFSVLGREVWGRRGLEEVAWLRKEGKKLRMEKRTFSIRIEQKDVRA